MELAPVSVSSRCWCCFILPVFLQEISNSVRKVTDSKNTFKIEFIKNNLYDWSKLSYRIIFKCGGELNSPDRDMSDPGFQNTSYFFRQFGDHVNCTNGQVALCYLWQRAGWQSLPHKELLRGLMSPSRPKFPMRLWLPALCQITLC